MSASAGRALLYAILRDGDQETLLSLQPEWFQKEHELPVFDFVFQYFQKHRELPPLSLVTDKYNIATVEGAVGYWKDEFTKRRFILTYDERIHEVNTKVMEGNVGEVMELLADVSRQLAGVYWEELKPRTRAELLQGVLDRIPERRSAGGITGIPLPWPGITGMLRGVSPKNVYVIAARKKVGKTQATVCISDHAYNLGYDTLYISMEMTEEEYALRKASLVSGINLNMLMTGRVSTPAMRHLENIIQKEKGRVTRFDFIEGFFSTSLSEIENRIIRHQPKLVIIDGAYLIRMNTSFNRMSGWEKVTEIMKGLKIMAGRHNVPIIATYQLNKEGEVHLSDSIQQIATAVLGMYEAQDRMDMRKLRVLDNRNGPRGESLLHWDFSTVNFREAQWSSEAGDDWTIRTENIFTHEEESDG